jgi:hypothetical protein
MPNGCEQEQCPSNHSNVMDLLKVVRRVTERKSEAI